MRDPFFATVRLDLPNGGNGLINTKQNRCFLTIQSPIIMNLYIAKIVYRIVCGSGDHAAQFDVQLRLVCALSEEQAFYKAKHYAKKEEDLFYNTKDELVQWQFINVSELYKIEKIADGAQLYSRIEEQDDGYAYVDVVNKKAQSMLDSWSISASVPGLSCHRAAQPINAIL